VLPALEAEKNTSAVRDWLFRFAKGVVIALGFLLPGVSGGVLAAIFGLYGRILRFMANITKDFRENFLFFLPVGLGGIAGIILLSAPLEFLLRHYNAIVMWCFAGCIAGTLPSLYREAGREGRGNADRAVFAVTFAAGFAALYGLACFEARSTEGLLPAGSFLTWVLAGALIALGIIVPGLSPSNLLIVLGLFNAMIDGFKRADLAVFFPIALGGAATLLLFSKVMERVLRLHYAKLYHFILGIVSASTLLIVIPPVVDYRGFSPVHGAFSLVLFALGCLLGGWMSGLEEKVKSHPPSE
jgi:putative membrane protein